MLNEYQLLRNKVLLSLYYYLDIYTSPDSGNRSQNYIIARTGQGSKLFSYEGLSIEVGF